METTTFEAAYELWIGAHAEQRTGERRGRLVRGHQYAEKLLLQHVWWPLFGNFDHLHPEYEVMDWNRKSQFMDFAYTPPFGRFGIECDGYQSHVKDMDRERFSYALNRDNYLTGMGWKMIHFSFDDIQHRPELCRMLLQLIVGPQLLRSPRSEWAVLTLFEKEVLRLACQMTKPIRTKDVSSYFQVGFRVARNALRKLCTIDLLTPISNGTYVTGYQVNERTYEKLILL
ncbi:hypothetical protein GXP70_21785 [Paenibacillus lycopersici]|uniref:DNA-binding response regulator n=1 Tax=Paenibacillus lycopersici TaxID=2704462 RepID=A0A6C0G5I6_9BACL|nr:hypothetical protein [Paenibacillus lycopersici]QHT62350.1 hypothetical protein GXP70_21785 [Paenibacillus lycopersici]